MMRWTIARRIAVGYAVMLVLLVVVAVVAILGLRRLIGEYDGAIGGPLTERAAALDAHSQYRRAVHDHIALLVSPDEAGFVERDSTMRLAREAISDLENLVNTPDARSRWAEVRRLYDQWSIIATRTSEALIRGDRAEALRLYRDEGVQIRERIRENFRVGTDEAVTRADSAIQAARDNAARREQFMLIAAGLAAVLGIITAMLLNRAVTNPLRETSSVLAASSAEIVAATSQQASGAAETASAVTETGATIEEITQTSEQAAERARLLADKAQRLVEVGRLGRSGIETSIRGIEGVREQVGSIASSILALADQAQAIGDIIATVNDFAEQTNLLALNAAVEAARAGDQGRGFAVVANEIKALAEQSKKATLDVRRILGEIQRATSSAVMTTEQGTKAVAEVTRQVSEGGETIRELADAVAETARTSAQIVASAGQQATGISQIRQAIENIQEAMQQNLASTRQTELAAQSLSDLSAELRRLVSGREDDRGLRA